MQLVHEIKATQEHLKRAEVKREAALQRKDEFRAEARALASELVQAQQDTQAKKDAAVAMLQAQACPRNVLHDHICGSSRTLTG